jgi:hypothetical protein
MGPTAPGWRRGGHLQRLVIEELERIHGPELPFPSPGFPDLRKRALGVPGTPIGLQEGKIRAESAAFEE